MDDIMYENWCKPGLPTCKYHVSPDNILVYFDGALCVTKDLDLKNST